VAEKYALLKFFLEKIGVFIEMPYSTYSYLLKRAVVWSRPEKR